MSSIRRLFLIVALSAANTATAAPAPKVAPTPKVTPTPKAVPTATKVSAEVRQVMEMSLEELTRVEVVYAVSRADQHTREVPSMVTVIKERDIRRQGFRTFADILALARGIFVTDDRNYNYVAMRGFGRPGDYNSHILLTIDGHRMNDALYGSYGVKNDFPLDLEFIDRIEIIRGPASSMYGDNAFFGVINVVTKRGRDAGPAFWGEAGSGRSFRRGAMAGGTTHDWDWLGGFSDYDSRGNTALRYPEYEEPGVSDGVARGCDGERNTRAFARMSRGGFRLLGVYSERWKGIPTGSYGTQFGDPRNASLDSSSFVEVMASGGDPESLENSVKLYLDHYAYSADYVYDYPPLTVNRDTGRADWWGLEWMASWHPTEAHTVRLGLEYRDLFTKKQDNYDDTGVYLKEDRSSRIGALFTQQEWRLAPPLLLSAGLRYDRYSTFGDNLAPRGALIALPDDRTTCKLIYGEAFRAPNDYEAFYEGNALSQKSNPQLRPERMRNLEFGTERMIGRSVSWSAGLYQYTMYDLIQQTVDPADGLAFYGNSGIIKARGFETILRHLARGGFDGRLAYCWQIARDEATDTEITNSPRHMGKLMLNEPLHAERLFLGQEILLLSSRRCERGGRVGGYGVVHLKLTADGWGWPGLLVNVAVYNVLDQSYRDPVAAIHRQDAIEQDGRSFWVKALYRL